MTITNGLITQDDLKTYLAIPTSDTADDAQLDDAVNTASRSIEAFCGRQFYDEGSATARKFRPSDWYCLNVDDFHTSVGLVIATDHNNDGTYETTWSASDYELDPGATAAHGVAGRPYQKIHAVGSRNFPVPASINSRQWTVQVTARWGWAAIPDPVKQSCLQVAAEEFRRKDAPFGVVQSVEFGPMRLSADTVRGVVAKLNPYIRASSRALVR